MVTAGVFVIISGIGSENCGVCHGFISGCKASRWSSAANKLCYCLYTITSGRVVQIRLASSSNAFDPQLLVLESREVNYDSKSTTFLT